MQSDYYNSGFSSYVKGGTEPVKELWAQTEKASVAGNLVIRAMPVKFERGMGGRVARYVLVKE